MIRTFPRRRVTQFESTAIASEDVARRFTSCSAVAMLAIAGLGFGVGLCWLADQWTGANVFTLMFAL